MTSRKDPAAKSSPRPAGIPSLDPRLRGGDRKNMSADNILSIQNLDIRFRVDRKSEPFRAVKGISFDIPRNSTVALVGESGSGKSVSAMSILGLLPENAIVAPESRVIYGGRDLLKANLREMQEI